MDDHVERLDRILAGDYLDALRARPMTELRSMRDECDEVEGELSYVRRLLQGRIDILTDELRRRSEGKTSSASDIVARLPAILADAPSGQTRGNRLLRVMAPSRMEASEQSVEDLLGMPLGDIATAEAFAIQESLVRLRNSEHHVSERRRAFHVRLDAVQSEMARRYRDGEASVESLLRQE